MAATWRIWQRHHSLNCVSPRVEAGPGDLPNPRGLPQYGAIVAPALAEPVRSLEADRQ